MHCADAGCVKVCPSAGALYHTKEGLVAYNQEKCIDCQYCVNGCPFDVPRYDEQEKVTKCHACFDRVAERSAAGLRQGLPDRNPAVR